MDDNEMLSHIFLGCIPTEKIVEIRDKYIGDKDWDKESVKIPVEMKIGGVEVNPKKFFDEWYNQMASIVRREAEKLLSEKTGSGKIRDIIDQLENYEQVLESWESEINWNVKNPFNTEENKNNG